MLASPLTTASPYAPARSILHCRVTLRPVWVAFTMYQDCTFRQRICTPSSSLQLLLHTTFPTQYLYSTSHFVCIGPSPHLSHLLFLSLPLFHPSITAAAAASASASPTHPLWDRPHDVASMSRSFFRQPLGQPSDMFTAVIFPSFFTRGPTT